MRYGNPCWTVAIITISIATLIGCSGKPVSTEQLRAYVVNPDNGLIKESVAGDIDVKVMFKPSDLIVAEQLAHESKPVELLRNNFDTLTFFVLSMSLQGNEIENRYASDERRFNEVTTYLASSIKEDLYVLADSDTIRPLEVVYTRMHGMARATSVMIVYDLQLPADDDELVFCFDDRMLGLGRVRLTFDQDDLKRIPRINFKQI